MGNPFGEMSLSTWLQGITSVGVIALTINRWVYRREGKETEMMARIDTLEKDYVRVDAEHEKIRALREAHVDGQLKTIKAEIDSLHEKASRFGTEQQSRMSNLQVDIITVKARQDEVFRILERRSEERRTKP